MVPPSRTIEPELLLAQAGWVRALVRRLVLDESLTEDIVQDTWVAALERSPGAAGAGGLRAWLSGVARNLALRRRRREAVRAALERGAARHEGVDGGQFEVERMQLQRELVDAVLALEEPFRSAVIQRHLDGLSAAEIARRQGCTPAAARQRVHRGLVELRRRLEHRFGGSRGCLALAPLLGRGWNPMALAGGITVGSKTLVAAAGAVVAVLALWWTTVDPETPRGVGAGFAATEEHAHPAPSERETVAVPPGGREGAAVGEAQVAPSTRLPDTRVESEPSRAFTAVALRVLVTDTHGTPLPDAALRVGLSPEPLELTSDAGGHFRASVSLGLTGRPLRLEVEREGYLSRVLEHDLALPLTIELQALPVIVGRLLEPSGVPLREHGWARATILDAKTRESHREEVSLAEDGSFRLEGLPLGRLVVLEGRALGFASTERTLDLALEPDEVLEQDLTLGPGAIVTGTVLDATTREPLPGAEVWMDAFDLSPDAASPSTTADENGRFRLVGADEQILLQEEGRIAVFWIVARAEGYAASPLKHYASTPTEEHTYDFEILLARNACSLRVRAVLPDGRPAAGATMWAIDAEGNPFWDVADAEGERFYENLPAGAFGLWMEYEGPRSLPSAEDGILQWRPNIVGSSESHALRADLELAPGEARSEEFVLDPRGKAGLVGRVLDAEGHGVPDFAVRAQLNFDLHELRLASGWEELRTDADGAYRFEGLHPGLYQVWASGEGTPFACTWPHDVYLRVEKDQVATVPDLSVGACVVFEGRIESGSISMGDLELVLLDPEDGEERAQARPGPEGDFRFEPAMARRYELVLRRGGNTLDRLAVGPDDPKGLFLRAR